MSVNEKMTAIADAIREKTGGTELLGLDAMAQAIAAIKGGGVGEWEHEIISGSFTPTSNVTSGTYYVDIGIPQPNYGEEGYDTMHDSHFLMFLDLPDEKKNTSSFYNYEFMFGVKFGNLTNYTYSNGEDAAKASLYGWRNSNEYDKITTSLGSTSFYIMQHPDTKNICFRLSVTSGSNQLRAGRTYTWMMIKREFR